MKKGVVLKSTIFIASGLIAALGLVGCSPSSPSPEPQLMPSVIIDSPSEGAELTLGDITVEVDVSNFEIVGNLGEATVEGEGHLHFYMDVEVPTTPGEPAVTEEGTYAVGTSTMHTWENVQPGEHTFAVQLVNNDHTPLEPPVMDKVTVQVENEPDENGNGESVSVDLSADNIAFDKDEITVPAGSMVTIVFNNEEAIPHNFALYETSAASTGIFVGEVITGPQVIEYEFMVPSMPGDYFFRCDVHPTVMTGTFIVE